MISIMAILTIRNNDNNDNNNANNNDNDDDISYNNDDDDDDDNDNDDDDDDDDDDNGKCVRGIGGGFIAKQHMCVCFVIFEFRANIFWPCW